MATSERRLRETNAGQVVLVENVLVASITDSALKQGKTIERLEPAATFKALDTTDNAAQHILAEDTTTEQIIRQKAREAIGHLFSNFDGSAVPSAMSPVSAATALDRVLNP